MTILKATAALAILFPVLAGPASANAASQGESRCCECIFAQRAPSEASRESRPLSRLRAAPIPCWLKPDQEKCREKMLATTADRMD